MEKSKVYFTKEITPESVVKMYEALGISLPGKVAIKLHSGEKGNQNYIRPEFVRPIVEKLNATVVECNAAYGGARNTTEKHKKLIDEHHWTKYFNVDIMDEEGPDVELEIPNGKILKQDFVGKHINNYDSMLVVSHFKGHPMGGFGGALKNMSIGLASSRGKAWIHSGGVERDNIWTTPQVDFIESMAEADKAVVDYFKNIVYINVVNNISVDCDCVANPEAPCMQDIGILASLDPVALDQACLDLIYNSNDPGKNHFIERVESRQGKIILDHAEELGIGSKEYQLVNID